MYHTKNRSIGKGMLHNLFFYIKIIRTNIISTSHSIRFENASFMHNNLSDIFNTDWFKIFFVLSRKLISLSKRDNCIIIIIAKRENIY